jgi:hypothetical protein
MAVDYRSVLPMARWRQPGLSHGTFDEVLRAVAALWANKRSDVLAPHAGLDSRQSRGGITSVAQWPLVLSVEHTTPPCRAGAGHRSLSPIDANTER